MRMMIDAYAPEGITDMAVDSIFMMPHLGVLSTVNEQAATEVFERDCIVSLGACIAPVGNVVEGKPALKVDIELPDKGKIEFSGGCTGNEKIKTGSRPKCRSSSHTTSIQP